MKPIPMKGLSLAANTFYENGMKPFCNERAGREDAIEVKQNALCELVYREPNGDSLVVFKE